MDIRIHALLPRSQANGPGMRAVVWLQGCRLNCPGCFNPLTHPVDAGKSVSVDDLCEELLKDRDEIEGISISGGEPFLQEEALFELLTVMRSQSKLSIIVFSGFTFAELNAEAGRERCLPLIDALVCGPYKEELPPDYEHFCSSSNQALVLLSERYRYEDFSDLPLQECIIDADGVQHMSGIFRI